VPQVGVKSLKLRSLPLKKKLSLRDPRDLLMSKRTPSVLDKNSDKRDEPLRYPGETMESLGKGGESFLHMRLKTHGDVGNLLDCSPRKI